MAYLDDISDFLNTAPRYKLVIVPNSIEDIRFEWNDIGHYVGDIISLNIKNDSLPFIVQTELEELFLSKQKTDKDFGEYICLSNIGILFEEALFSPLPVIQSLAKNCLVFLQCSGELKDRKLYILKEGSPYYLNLTETNYITI